MYLLDLEIGAVREEDAVGRLVPGMKEPRKRESLAKGMEMVGGETLVHVLEKGRSAGLVSSGPEQKEGGGNRFCEVVH